MSKTVLSWKDLTFLIMKQTTTRGLIKAATEELQLSIQIDWKNKEERENERQAAWKEKALHDQFPRGDARSKDEAVAESR